MEEKRFGDFFILITGLYRDLQKLKANHKKILGLKTTHMFWLYLLQENSEGLSASSLAQKGKSSRALVSREIQELTERGLIKTDEQTEHRRYGWKFTLTEEGRKLAKRITEIGQQAQNSVSQGIPVDNINIFYQTLEQLLNNFDQLVSNQKE